MTQGIEEPEVRSYLAALQARLAHLPADQTDEILFGVREHIAEAMERGGQPATGILAGLGSPDDIAAGLAAPDAPARQLPQAAPARRHQDSTMWVVATCILLPFGVFLAGIGWLFGVAGLWMGTRWKRWEKIMGTVLLPGGVLGAGYLAALPFRMVAGPAQDAASGSNPLLPGLPLGGTLVLASLPVIVAVYLLVAGLRRGPSRQWGVPAATRPPRPVGGRQSTAARPMRHN